MSQRSSPNRKNSNKMSSLSRKNNSEMNQSSRNGIEGMELAGRDEIAEGLLVGGKREREGGDGGEVEEEQLKARGVHACYSALPGAALVGYFSPRC